MESVHKSIIAAIGSKPTNTITAHAADGRKTSFTYDVLALLKTDPTIAYITDDQTGEIIHER